MGMADPPDERYLIGVADRAETGSREGLQYHELVRSILRRRRFRKHGTVLRAALVLPLLLLLE